MANSLKKDDWKPAEKKEAASAFIREFFIVHCAGFLGMAYRHSNGKWLDAFNHRELPDDVWVLG